MHIVNNLMAFYSYVELGCPDVTIAPPSFYSGAPRGHRVLRQRAEQLVADVLPFVRPGASQEALGGGRLRVAQQLKSCLKGQYGWVDPEKPPVGAEWVNNDILDLPEQGGLVPLAGLLTPEQRCIYENPDALSKSPDAWGAIPKPCHRVKPGDEHALQESLLQRNMAGLVPESAVPRTPCGKILIGGSSVFPNLRSRVSRGVKD